MLLQDRVCKPEQLWCSLHDEPDITTEESDQIEAESSGLLW
jgi:hypothetical protein